MIDALDGIDPCNSGQLKLSVETRRKILASRLKIGNPPCMTPEIRRQFIALALEYESIFSLHAGDLGAVPRSILEMHIDLVHDRPLIDYHTKVPLHLQEQFTQMLKDLERGGVIEKSTSAKYRAPVVLVAKPNGKLRMAVSFKLINAALDPNSKTSWVIPKDRPLLDKLCRNFSNSYTSNSSSHTTCYSSLDLKDAFFQLQVAQEDVHKLTFSTHIGLYCLKRMPQGLQTSAFLMQQLSDFMFSDIQDIVTNYIDDTIVTASSTASSNPSSLPGAVVKTASEQMLINLRQVFECYKRVNLKISPEKSLFFKGDSLIFLGRLIKNGRILPDPGKTEAIKKIPLCKTLRSLRSFLSTIGFYREHIRAFAQKAAPLYDLLKGKGDKPKNVSIAKQWTKVHTASFESLKQGLIDAFELHAPVVGREFRIVTDAATGRFGGAGAIGGVVYQADEDGKFHPLAAFSKVLPEASARWGASQLELQAIITLYTKYRLWFLGSRLTIVTDCRCLIHA